MLIIRYLFHIFFLLTGNCTQVVGFKEEKKAFEYFQGIEKGIEFWRIDSHSRQAEERTQIAIASSQADKLNKNQSICDRVLEHISTIFDKSNRLLAIFNLRLRNNISLNLLGFNRKMNGADKRFVHLRARVRNQWYLFFPILMNVFF